MDYDEWWDWYEGVLLAMEEKKKWVYDGELTLTLTLTLTLNRKPNPNLKHIPIPKPKPKNKLVYDGEPATSPPAPATTAPTTAQHQPLQLASGALSMCTHS